MKTCTCTNRVPDPNCAIGTRLFKDKMVKAERQIKYTGDSEFTMYIYHEYYLSAQTKYRNHVTK